MFFGRAGEIKEIDDALYKAKIKKEATLIKVDGRRKVGKTRLVKEYINQKVIDGNAISLCFIGNKNLTKSENIKDCFYNLFIQLEQFSLSSQCNSNTYSLNELLLEIEGYHLNFKKTNPDWAVFFNVLKKVISKINDKNIFIFFDEVSWFDKQSLFINKFANYWNMFFFTVPNLTFFIASSVTYWLNEKLTYNNNVLFQRINLNIVLKPFSLKEIYEYFLLHKQKKIEDFDQYKNEVIRYYMIFGGVLKYYEYIDMDKSYEENIEYIKNNFKKIIQDEENLIESLFDKKYRFVQHIFYALCKSRKLYFEEIKMYVNQYIKVSDITLRECLKHLSESNLIIQSPEEHNPVFMIADMFIYFTYYWNNKIKLFNSFNQDYSTWKGMAFELLVILNQDLINKKSGLFNSDNININYYINWLSKQQKTNNRSKNKIKSQVDILVEATFSKTITNIDLVKIFELKMTDDVNGFYFNEAVFLEMLEKADDIRNFKEENDKKIPLKNRKNHLYEIVLVTNNKIRKSKQDEKDGKLQSNIYSIKEICIKDLL